MRPDNNDPVDSPPVRRDEPLSFVADDGYALHGTVHRASDPRGIVVVNGATAVPHRFYRRFAAFLAGEGYTTLTYDYRGVGASREGHVRRSRARMRDWGLLDMEAAISWAEVQGVGAVNVVGHSVGGQLVGMVDRPERVRAMVTVSAQSGHWRYQGGSQKAVVAAHTHLTLPLAARTLCYVPWSRLGAGEDLPSGVALEWSRWCRDRHYVLGDRTLPLDRYGRFTAPILALSISDDAWGTARSVDVMMGAYPSVTRRHVRPQDAGIGHLGHMGFFRPTAEPLWSAVVAWFDAPGSTDSGPSADAPSVPV